MNTTVTSSITSFAANQKLINETFIANAANFGNIRAAYLPISELFVDSDYQRKPQKKINQIAAAWDDDKCGFLEVSYRKDLGKFAIIDGQNRFYAAKQCGLDRLPCHIVIDISAKEEAYRFASQDDNKTVVDSYDKFRAELFAGNAESVCIKQICDRYSIKIKKSAPSQTGHLRSITMAKSSLKTIGEAGLCWIFDVIRESGWHNVKNAYSYVMMQALHNIYLLIDPENLNYVKERITKLFEKQTPDYIVMQSMIAFNDASKSSALTRFLQKTCIAEYRPTMLTK